MFNIREELSKILEEVVLNVQQSGGARKSMQSAYLEKPMIWRGFDAVSDVDHGSVL